MRLRNVVGAHEKLARHDLVINDAKEYKGKWQQLFNNDHAIHIEIGMGKGQFITTLAKKNPHINYIGFEKYTSVLVRALDKIDEEENLNNIVVVRMDVEEILNVFEKGEIERVYLNFSDPWPKDRHAKRRLTHKNFLEKYKVILKEDGVICFKTDNKDLFDFSLEEIKNNGWVLSKVTRDLHNSDYLEGNVMTEYEEKFVEKGLPIYRLEASRIMK